MPTPPDRIHDAWFWLAGVEVTAPNQTGAVAILGDSITDGVRSTPDGNNRWPDYLARRLATVDGNHADRCAEPGHRRQQAAERYRRIQRAWLATIETCCRRPGSRTSLRSWGTTTSSSCSLPPRRSASTRIIAGHRQLIRRAHARGVKIYGATLTPFGGFGLYSAEKESKRQASQPLDSHKRRVRRGDRFRCRPCAIPNDPTRLQI